MVSLPTQLTREALSTRSNPVLTFFNSFRFSTFLSTTQQDRYNTSPSFEVPLITLLTQHSTTQHNDKIEKTPIKVSYLAEFTGSGLPSFSVRPEGSLGKPPPSVYLMGLVRVGDLICEFSCVSLWIELQHTFFFVVSVVFMVFSFGNSARCTMTSPKGLEFDVSLTMLVHCMLTTEVVGALDGTNRCVLFLCKVCSTWSSSGF